MSEFNSHNEGPLTHLSPEILEGYIKGELPATLREKVQAYLEANPFEAEAMEGLIGQPGLNLQADLQQLEARLQAKTAPVKNSGFVWWRLAAVLLLLALSGMVVYFFLPDNTNSGVAIDQPLVNDEKDVSAFEGGVENRSLENSPVTDSEQEQQQEQDQEVLPETAPAPSSGQQSPTPINSPQPLNEPQPELSSGAALSAPLGQSKAKEAEAAEVEEFAEVAEVAPAENAINPPEDDLDRSQARSAAPKKVPEKKEKNMGFLTLNNAQEIPYEYKIVVGKVLNSQTGGPVAGANVSIKGTSLATVSDQNGFFHFEAPVEAQSLVSNSVGFGSREIAIREQAQITVFLDEEVASLSEVVTDQQPIRKRKFNNKVDASGTRDAVEEESPKPEDVARPPSGIDEYLATNTLYPPKAESLGVEGTVIVSFTVLADGAVNDFIIVQKLGFGCDEAAVEVLKNGPRWKPAQAQGKNVPSQAQIEVNFPPNQ